MFSRNGFPGKMGKNEPKLPSGILLKCILNMCMFSLIHFLARMKLVFFVQSFFKIVEPNEPESIPQDWLRELDWISDEVFLPSSGFVGDTGVSEKSYHDSQPTVAELALISNQWDEILSQVGLWPFEPQIPFIASHHERDNIESSQDRNTFSGDGEGPSSPSKGTQLFDWIMDVDLNPHEPENDVAMTGNSPDPSNDEKLKLSVSDWETLFNQVGQPPEFREDMTGDENLTEEVSGRLESDGLINEASENADDSKVGVRFTSEHEIILWDVILHPKHGETRMDVFRRTSEAFEETGLLKISFSSFLKRLRRIEKRGNISRNERLRKYTPLHHELLEQLVLLAGPSYSLRSLFKRFLEQLKLAGLLPMKFTTFASQVSRIRNDSRDS